MNRFAFFRKSFSTHTHTSWFRFWLLIHQLLNWTLKDWLIGNWFEFFWSELAWASLNPFPKSLHLWMVFQSLWSVSLVCLAKDRDCAYYFYLRRRFTKLQLHLLNYTSPFITANCGWMLRSNDSWYYVMREIRVFVCERILGLCEHRPNDLLCHGCFNSFALITPRPKTK